MFRPTIFRRQTLRAVVAPALLLVAVACAPAAVPTAAVPTAAPQTAATTAPMPLPPLTGRLTILAAASLTESFNAIIDGLRKANPALQVEVSYAGSQALRTQIENGVAFDVFASADGLQMAPVERSGLVQPAVPFVRNRLAVIVPKANPARITSLADLGRPSVKLVLAAPNVPVGNYTRDAFSRAAATPGFGADFRERALRNVVSDEDNVRQVLTKVQLGEADAGVVYTSDVTPRAAAGVTLIPIDDAYNTIATYPIAIAARPGNAAAAERFVATVLGPAGKAALRANNFTTLD